MDLLKCSSPYFSRVFCPGDGFSKSILRFTKTTDFFTKMPGLKGKGSWMTSDFPLFQDLGCTPCQSYFAALCCCAYFALS